MGALRDVSGSKQIWEEGRSGSREYQRGRRRRDSAARVNDSGPVRGELGCSMPPPPLLLSPLPAWPAALSTSLGLYALKVASGPRRIPLGDADSMGGNQELEPDSLWPCFASAAILKT